MKEVYVTLIILAMMTTNIMKDLIMICESCKHLEYESDWFEGVSDTYPVCKCEQELFNEECEDYEKY